MNNTATLHGCPRFLVLVLLLLTAGGCRTTDPPGAASPLAVYSGGVITRVEHEDWLLTKRKTTDSLRLREDLERIVVTDSLAKAAGEENLLSDPVTGFMVRRAEEGVLARALQEAQGEGISFTDDELRAAFEGRPENRFKPTKYRLREIFLRIPPGASEEEEAERRSEAETLRVRLEDGADIGALAREYSDSQTRLQGGYVGVVDPAKLGPSIAEAVRRLHEGEMTPVLQTPDGFLILSCDLIVPERRHTFEESREKVRSILQRRETRHRWTRLQEELLEEARPHYDFGAFQDRNTPSEATVLRYAAGELSHSQAEVLLLSGARSNGDRSRWTEARLRAVLEAFLIRSMAARRARELGLDRGPEIQARLRWARKEALSMQELARRLSRRITPPGPEDIREEIEANPSRYRHPAESLLSVIRLGGEAARLRQFWEEATQLVDGLRSGDLDFSETARRRSSHPSAAEGGDLGWRSQVQLGSLGSSVAATVQEMETGEIRGPVQERAVLWILKLWDRRGPRPMVYAEARPLAEERLGNRLARSLQLEIEAEILEGFRIVGDEQ